MAFLIRLLPFGDVLIVSPFGSPAKRAGRDVQTAPGDRVFEQDAQDASMPRKMSRLRRLIDDFQEVKFWSAEGDSGSVGFPQTCQSSQTERPQEREEYMAAILSCVGSFFNGSVLPVETRVHWPAAGVKWQETSLTN